MTAVVEVRIECDGCGQRYGPYYQPVTAGTGCERLIAHERARHTDPHQPLAHDPTRHRPHWDHQVVDDESVDLCPTCKTRPWPPARPGPAPRP